MDNLLLNPASRKALERIAKRPPHAIMLTGAAGSGKYFTARVLAARIFGTPVDAYPYYRETEPVNGTISIETIRDLQKFLQLKTPGQAVLRRALVISGAETMTTEAQNAFLKTLEEPPADTIVILTVVSPESVLPTIQSRAVAVRILPVSLEDSQTHYKQHGVSNAAIKQAWALARGQAGLLNELVNGNQEHELLVSVARAKALLGMNTLERLAVADEFAKDKVAARQLLEALERIACTAMEGAANNGKTDAVQRWHRVATQVARSRYAQERNANGKLLISDLMLNLS